MGGNQLSEPELLRDYYADYLSGISDLASAKVLSRKVANLQNEIERSLAKEGLCVLVTVLTAQATGDQSSRVVLDPTNFVFRVTENVLFNRQNGGPSALYIATRIAALLTHHKPPFPWAGLLIPGKPTIRELNILTNLEEEEDSDDYSGFDVFFTTKVAIQPRQTSN